jgi:hypothetical protein
MWFTWGTFSWRLYSLDFLGKVSECFQGTSLRESLNFLDELHQGYLLRQDFVPHVKPRDDIPFPIITSLVPGDMKCVCSPLKILRFIAFFYWQDLLDYPCEPHEHVVVRQPSQWARKIHKFFEWPD